MKRTMIILLTTAMFLSAVGTFAQDTTPMQPPQAEQASDEAQINEVTQPGDDQAADDAVPPWPEREFAFEISETPLNSKDYQARPGLIWPEFAVPLGTYIPNSAYEGLFWKPGRGDDPVKRTEALLNTSAAARFSAKQTEFVKTSPWLTSENRKSSNYMQMTLYAMSAEDAKLMVEAVFELMDAPIKPSFEEMRTKLLEKLQLRDERRAKLADAQRVVEEANTSYQAALQSTGYENRECARRALEQIDDALRMIEVSIAGINAKRDAIRKMKSEKLRMSSESTRLMVDQLLIEQDIDLAGALAQQESLLKHRETALTLIRARDAYDAALETTRKLNDEISSIKNGIEQWRKRLDNPRNSVGMALLAQKLVVIQPVEFTHD